jgi:predicted kinase
VRAPERPVAVVVTGPPGSGKSTLGEALAPRLGAALLDQDVLTNPLVAVVAGLVGAGDDLDHPRLRALVRDPRYAALLDVARQQLRTGLPVVLVAPFTAETTDRAAWEALSAGLRDAGATAVHLVRCTAPADVRAARMRARDAPRDRARPARAPGGTLRPVDGVPGVAVDTTAPLAAQVEQVLAAVG